MQSMWLCIRLCRQFEDTFKNAQWRKFKQMQPVWLCICWDRQSEDTFENGQWRKAKQMQQVWLCIYLCTSFKDTFDNTRWRKVKLAKKWHVGSVESFEYSNNIYSEGYLDVNLRRWQNYLSCDGTGDNIEIYVFLSLQMRMEDKISCVAVLSFFNLDKYIWQLGQIHFGQTYLAIWKNTFWT